VVTWEDFERWWRERAGDDEGTVPVLPEAMVTRVADMSTATTMDQLKTENPDWTASDHRWAFLKPRLVLLMRMEKVWGEISNLYGSADSVYGNDLHSLPKGIRSPESQFTQM